MHLVQIFLPLADNAGEAQPRTAFRQTREELAGAFGGLTVYSRAPALGIWESEESHRSVDDMIVIEVMVDDLDRAWWAERRKLLEARFRQERIVIRALPMQAL